MEVAKKLECTISQLAIAWVLKNPDVSSCILGATKIDQLEENLGALDFKMDEEDINLICKYVQQARQKKFVVGNKYFGLNILG